MKVGAVVLAAGGSSRLGKPKQLLQFHGQSLVRRTVEAAISAECLPVAVVLGAESERVKSELAGLAVVLVPNEDWRRGIGASIRRGVRALQDGDAIAILTCDQPHIDREVIKNLIRGQEQTQKAIVACAYSGTLGVPALFARQFFEDLLSLSNEQGAKWIIEAHPNDIAAVPFPSGAVDIDTPEDYRRLLDYL